MNKNITIAMTIHAIDCRLRPFPDSALSEEEGVVTGGEGAGAETGTDAFWHCTDRGVPQRLGFPLNVSAEKPAKEEGMLPPRLLLARFRSSRGGREKLGMVPEKLFP